MTLFRRGTALVWLVAAMLPVAGAPAAERVAKLPQNEVSVIAAPTVTKSFAPSSILATQPSTLTITLTNSSGTAITGAAFTDTYPTGVVNRSTPNGATTCTGGTVTATAGGSSVALSGGTIPANGSCTVTVSLTANGAGTYQNSIAVGAVTSSNAPANAAAATATLTAAAFNSIPTLDPTMLGALAAMLAIAGLLAMRRG